MSIWTVIVLIMLFSMGSAFGALGLFLLTTGHLFLALLFILSSFVLLFNFFNFVTGRDGEGK